MTEIKRDIPVRPVPRARSGAPISDLLRRREDTILRPTNAPLIGVDNHHESKAASARRNAEVIRAMGLGHQLERRWTSINARYLQDQLRAADASGGIGAVSKILRLLLQSGISGDAPDPGPLPVITRDTFVLAVPWLLVALLAIGVGASFFLRWRRKVEERRAADWDAYHQANAATTADVTAVSEAAAGPETNQGAQ